MDATRTYRIEVLPRHMEGETLSGGKFQAIQQAGIGTFTGGIVARVFFLKGDLTPGDVQRLSARLLADPVTEVFTITSIDSPQMLPSFDHTIDVTLLPGVTDPVAENLLGAARLMGLTSLQDAATGQRYLLRGQFDERELHRTAAEVFSNPLIQQFAVDRPVDPPFVPFQSADGSFESIPLAGTEDRILSAISEERRLALNLAEMKAIQAYFRQAGREPTDVELETLAQTWSEHCVHKTFKATVDYTGPLPGSPPGSTPQRQMVAGILDTYIRAATDKIAKPWVRSAFVDNAGIVALTDGWDVAFKVETHNHPSALEPFGGANTGVGGVVRDILGVSARPIANTDVLCFGPQDLPDDELPGGALHPRRVAEGVVRGVEDYGNKMGIPTVNGAVLYHPDYTANPLVFCGCVGLLPHGAHADRAQPGDRIVVLGGRTGRDGLRGATFSSMEMDHSTAHVAGSAVQIGHPIHEKQALEVVLSARDARLYNAITDCGAGGLSSAVGEMGKDLGARVHLDRVPLKYPGLRPWEIWLSEAQERMVLAVPEDHWDAFQALCATHDIEAVCIGEFEPTGRLLLLYEERQVGELSMDFLHDGLPLLHLEARWEPAPAPGDITYPAQDDLAPSLLRLLAHPNIRSKEAIVRLYDHEVQGATAVKPMVGVEGHGPGDAAVLAPLEVIAGAGDDIPLKGIALAAGICPAYGEIDPYAMAWAAVDEAMRNLVAVGADPDQVALLDNFCWGNPNLPDRMGSLVRCAQGCYDAALAYGAPFISGKDSLNNEFTGPDGRKHAIPGTLLISGLGIVPDVSRTVTMDLKQPGNLLYLVGKTRAEMGGSHYHHIQGIQGSLPPQPVPEALQTMKALHKAIQMGIVQACHDCSEGGLAVALAEMCIAGRLGADIDILWLSDELDIAFTEDDEQGMGAEIALFSESSCRFIVEVPPDADDDFIRQMPEGVPVVCLGKVTADLILKINSMAWWQADIDLPVADLEKAWRGAASGPSMPALDPRPQSKPIHAPAARITSPKVCILHAKGSNRDREAAAACQLAGGAPEIVYVSQLVGGEKHLRDYQMLVIPGGFSYGDDLGAGVLWAMTLQHRLGDELARFIDDGRPALGICNGFQVLVKAGLLPGPKFNTDQGYPVTLAANEAGHFECRWVYLKANPASPSLFTEGLDELIYCPVAHGEGRLIAQDDELLETLQRENLAALTYVDAAGNPASYPGNPNGSALGIAGLCNPAGNVLGLMPHPEDHIFGWQRPDRHRGAAGMTGLRLFENGIRHA